MSFCPNCGSEINDGALFCGNCGKKTQNEVKSNNSFKTGVDIDFKRIINVTKDYFLNFYVDYNSKFFRFVMVLLLALGIGSPLYSSSTIFLPEKLFNSFSGAYEMFEFFVCAILFGIFSLFLLRHKEKIIVKKSDLLAIVWIVAVILNIIVFIAGIEIYQYILYAAYASNIVEILLVVFTVLLLLKNRPKSPLFLIISAISFALSKTSLWQIKFQINIYKIWETTECFIDVLESMRYILLIIVLFLFVYLIPKKISKWLMLITVLLLVIKEFIDFVKDFSFAGILEFVLDISLVALFGLLAYCCSRKIKYDYIIENQKEIGKRTVKIGVISAICITIILTAYLLISALVCSAQINVGINRWKNKINSGNMYDSEQWKLMNNEVFKYNCTKLVDQFVDEYEFYEMLKDNKYSMQKINECYIAFENGKVNDDIIDEYYGISVDESWSSNETLSIYYDKYIEMQPKSENVSVSSYIDVNNGQIEITVNNNNLMPISKCTVDCKFTIIYVESGSYSSNEYGRGTKTVEITDVAGNSKRTETVMFDPDDYYDSYGSYITAFLMDKSVTLISIE